LSRSASCARTVCEIERSGSRSLMASLRGLGALRRGLAGHHAVDHTPRPHRAGIDVEIVEGTIRIFADSALLRLEDDFVLAKDVGDAVTDFGGQLLLGQAVIAHEGP